MLQFSITITGEDKDLTPAVQALVAALAQGNAAVSVDAPAEPEKPKTSSRKSPAKKQEAAEEPEVKEDAPAEEADTDNEPEQADEPDTVEDVPTDVEIRAKAAEVRKDAAKIPKIKELLDKYGSKNISSIPENKRAAFMRDLEML